MPAGAQVKVFLLDGDGQMWPLSLFGRGRVYLESRRQFPRFASIAGWTWIARALSNLGYVISDQTVGNVLRRYGLPPAPERKRTTRWSV